MAEQIDYPAPLPEGPADALLAKMLTPALYKVPEKTKKAKGTRKSSQRQASSSSPSDDSTAHSSPKDEEEEEEEDAPPPTGGDKKRKAAPIGEAGGSNKGRTLLPDSSITAADGEDEWLPYSDTRVTHSIPLLHCFP